MELKTAEKRDFIFTNRVIGNTVFMLLDKGIGKFKDDTDPYIVGSAFAEEVYYWKSQGMDITVKINSVGGSVFEGWSIIDAIRESEASTQCIGVAASMAGVCLMFGKKRSAYNFARIMIHAPRGGSKEFLEVVKSQFRDLLKSRTKFSEAEINDMIDSGKDYFFNAYEAKQKGIIDEVIETGKTVALSDSELTNTRAMYLVYNTALKEELKNKQELNMANVFAKFFKKETEEDAVIAAAEMRSENESLKSEKATWATEKKALEDKIKALENAGKETEAKSKGKELIEGAIKAGKLTFKDEAEKNKAIEGAVANYDFTKQMIDSMPTKKTVAASTIVDDSKKGIEKTYEWLAKNDPQQLAAIAESDPELFNRLSDEYNESQKTKEAK